MTATLLDAIEPVWHIHEYHETIVKASAFKVYAALRTLPVKRSLLSRVLMGLRTLPARLVHRRKTTRRNLDLNLIDAMTSGGFVLLDELPGEEIVLGLAGRFWQIAPGLVKLHDRDDYLNFRQDGSARTCVNFRIEALDAQHARLSTETRVRCFGGGQRRFKLYWMLISPFSALIRRDWLRLIKQRSEVTAV